MKGEFLKLFENMEVLLILGNRLPKFLTRLFLFNMLLGTLPVIVLGVLSYYKSSEIIQDKVTKANRLNLEQTQQSVEQLLKMADLSAVQFMNSSLVSSALNMPLTANQFETVNDLLQGLHKLQSFELGINDIWLVSFNNGWVIDNSTEVLRLEALNQKEMIHSYAKVDKSSFWTTADGGKQVHLVKKLPLHAQSPSGLIIIKFMNKEITKLLTNNNELGEVMILDHDGIVIAHSNEEQIGQDFRDKKELQFMFATAEAVGDNHAKINTDMGVNFRKSSYNNWTYVSISSVNLITKDSKVIKWYTYTACLLIFVGTLFVALLGSRKMYSPISRLYRFLAEKEEGSTVKRSSDEFQYIDSQVYEMLYAKNRLSGIVEGQQRYVDELFMIKLYQGEVRAQEMTERMDAITSNRNWHYIGVMAIQIDTLEGTRYENRDEELLLFAINNIAGEVLNESERLKPVVMQRTQVTLIGSNETSEELFKLKINAYADETREKIDQFLGLKASVGISRFYPTVESAPWAYQDATEALKYTIRMGPSCIIHIMDVEPEGTILSHIPDGIKQELLDAIKLADYAQADQLLHKYLQDIFNEKVGHREYFVPLTSFLLDLVRMAQSLGEPIDSLYDGEKSLIDQLYQLKTIKEMEQWFSQILIYPMMNVLEKKRKNQYAKISDQMLAMIHEEAETDLTLELCASRIGYHPDYIRGVFRKEVGLNFSDYLSNFRLQLAKKLLVDTDLKILEIAERLRYNNSQNFIRYFRKQEGITPGQYREKNQRQE